MAGRSETQKNKIELALLQAESGYIADPDRRPVEYWHDQYLAELGVPIRRTAKHAKSELWVEKRLSFWKGVQAAWLKQQRVKLVNTRISELHELQDLKAQIGDAIRPVVNDDGKLEFPFPVRSYEGIAGLFLKIDAAIDTKLDTILPDVENMLSDAEQRPEKEADPLKLPFTRDEMRHLAHQLLQKRRKKLAESNAVEKEEDHEIEQHLPSESEGREKNTG